MSNEKTKLKKFDNFYEEYCDNEVRVVLHNEKIINGKIVESRKYWIKLESGGTTYYINKAWILYIQPLKLVRK
jgi:sRNA-binding regulator protein Hfq